MKWWVRLNGKLVGWVIATSKEEAFGHARVKYPTDIDMGHMEVEPKARKRMKRARA